MNGLVVSTIETTGHEIFWGWTLVAAVGLAFIHMYCGKLRFLSVIPRSRWLSFASGVSVAYVFVHLLPELEEGQQHFEELEVLGLAFIESHIYLMSLLGLILFYGLEKLAISSRQDQQIQQEGDQTDPGIFWIHIASFAIYNSLIGYLLVHRENLGKWSLLIFAIAMAFHFIVNDFGLRDHHKHQYDKVGRWILASFIILGWGIGQAVEISEATLAALFAFLGGGIILNVIKEELPEERQSRFTFFCLGATLYTALLLILETL
jgi:zinc transporter ZupT